MRKQPQAQNSFIVKPHIYFNPTKGKDTLHQLTPYHKSSKELAWT